MNRLIGVVAPHRAIEYVGEAQRALEFCLANYFWLLEYKRCVTIHCYTNDKINKTMSC